MGLLNNHRKLAKILESAVSDHYKTELEKLNPERKPKKARSRKK